jgi:hypothetical protein
VAVARLRALLGRQISWLLPLKRGFQALYLMAMLCYVLAFMSELIFRNQDAAGDRDSDLSNRSARKIGKMAGTSPAISPNLLA